MKSLVKMSRKKSQGFTLIELMIAIAIVGILASIAVPAFSNYLARARISEAINYAQSCKQGFIEFYATNGTFPTTNGQANCPSITTANVEAVTLSARGLVVQLSTGNTIPAAIRGQFIMLQPTTAAGALAVAGNNIVSWRCSLSSTAAGAAATVAAQDLVPAICRNNPV